MKSLCLVLGGEAILINCYNENKQIFEEEMKKNERNETKQYIIEVYGLFGRFLGYADDLGMCLDKNINHAMRFSSILEAEKVAHDISTFIMQAEIKEL